MKYHAGRSYQLGFYAWLTRPTGSTCWPPAATPDLRRYARRRGYALADSRGGPHVRHQPPGFQRRWAATWPSCSLDKSIKLWDPASLALLRVLDRARARRPRHVGEPAWFGRAREQRLVSCSDDRSLAVWQVA
ncbi:MAG: hypothetical protein WKG07_49715 [Hymenobacter sp.]